MSQPNGSDTAYVREYFARDARTYDQRERFRRSMRAQLLAMAGVQPGDAVLDVCTGTGEVALALVQRGAVVTGVDLSPEMLDLARRKAPGARVQFLEADASRLPFADASFDVCTLAMGLHCMPASLRPRVLAEMARVARRRVALMEPNTPASPAGRWLLARIGHWQRSPKYWADFVASDLPAQVAAAGLVVEQRAVFNLGMHQALACRPAGR